MGILYHAYPRKTRLLYLQRLDGLFSVFDAYEFDCDASEAVNLPWVKQYEASLRHQGTHRIIERGFSVSGFNVWIAPRGVHGRIDNVAPL